MRTPLTAVREAILSPHLAVRVAASNAFAWSYTTDRTIMPQVIRAVEQYGWRQASNLFRAPDNLPQTDETLDWLWAELAKPWNLADAAADNHRFLIAQTLVEAAPTAWLRQRPTLPKLRAFPEELEEYLEDRLRLAQLDAGALWREIEHTGWGRLAGDLDLPEFEHRCDLLAEALAAQPGSREPLLRLLARRYRGFEKEHVIPMEPVFVAAAGRLRLEEAVPELVERLHENDYPVSDAAANALRRIGTETVVRTIAEQWADGDNGFRAAAAGVLARSPLDSAFRHCLEWFAQQTDGPSEESFVEFALADALLGHFHSDAVEPIRLAAIRLAEEENDEAENLQGDLAAACTIMGVEIAEGRLWLAAADEACRCRVEEPGFRERDEWCERDDDDFFGGHNPFDDDGDDDESEEWSDDDFDGDFTDGDSHAADDERVGEHDARFNRPGGGEGETPIFRDTPRISRNAPCPCGSGKKYKRCCLPKNKSHGS
jgi:hypothetical protein